MCAFDLFKDYGLKMINDDSFLNVAGQNFAKISSKIIL